MVARACRCRGPTIAPWNNPPPGTKMATPLGSCGASTTAHRRSIVLTVDRAIPLRFLIHDKEESRASQAFEVSSRVARQALVRPYQRDPGAPFTRPLRIYTLDPSVSDRIGGVATVQVPYEKWKPDQSARSSSRRGRCAKHPSRRTARSRSSLSSPNEWPGSIPCQRAVSFADGLCGLSSIPSACAWSGHRLDDRRSEAERAAPPHCSSVWSARGERRLQPRNGRPVVRLFYRPGQTRRVHFAGRSRLHFAQSRCHCARNDPCLARRTTFQLSASDQYRCSRLSRGIL